MSVDIHLEIEKKLAEFLGTEAAILYSQAFSAVSSVIPAFSKRGDIIVWYADTYMPPTLIPWFSHHAV